MKIQRKFWRRASVAICTGFLAGCGSQPTGVPQPSPLGAQAAPSSPTVNIVESRSQRQAPLRHERERRDLLNLTEAQKTQLQQIAEAHKDTIEAMQAGHQAIMDAMQASEVDEAVLAKAIDDHRASAKAAVPDLVKMAGEMRDVLTDEQRAKLVQMMARRMERRERVMIGRPGQEEGSGMPDPFGMKASHKALQAAFIHFLQTGDEDALANALNTVIDQMPDSATIAAKLANLTPEQREKLFAIGEHRRQTRHPAAVSE